jgi:hypothetical protein
MAIEVQFGGDNNAFPLWGRDGDGCFDVNLPTMRGMLSDELAAGLDAWSRRWATVDGGDADVEDVLADNLIAQARILSARVADELGPDYAVSVRWDAPR